MIPGRLDTGETLTLRISRTVSFPMLTIPERLTGIAVSGLLVCTMRTRLLTRPS